MKSLSKLCLLGLLLTVAIACKDTKKEEEAVAKAAIEKVEAVEAELESVTEDLEKKATDLDNSLSELDDI